MIYPEHYLCYTINNAAIISYEEVKVKSEKCSAPGCGEEINGECYKVRLSTRPKSFVYVHDFCFDIKTLTVVNWDLA